MFLGQEQQVALLWMLGGNSKTLDCKLYSDSLGTKATCLDDLQAAQPKPKAVGRLRRALRDSKVESNEIIFKERTAGILLVHGTCRQERY